MRSSASAKCSDAGWQVLLHQKGFIYQKPSGSGFEEYTFEKATLTSEGES